MHRTEDLIDRAEARMTTAEDRLRFVLEFAAMDLGQLRRGDWLNLQDDWQAFFCIDHVIVEGPRPQDYSPDEFRALQQEVQQLLKELVQQREATGHWPLAQHTTPFPVHVTYEVVPLDRLGLPGGAMFRWRGPTRDVFLLVFSSLLQQVGTGRIAQCPECGTICYRNHKRKYCSRRCVDRANQRSLRARQEPGPRRPRGRPAKQPRRALVSQAEPATI
jgi:hypothetical protein